MYQTRTHGLQRPPKDEPVKKYKHKEIKKKTSISASNIALINSAVHLSTWAARHKIDRAALTEFDFLLRLLCCEIRFTVSSRNHPPIIKLHSTGLFPFLWALGVLLYISQKSQMKSIWPELPYWFWAYIRWASFSDFIRCDRLISSYKNTVYFVSASCTHIGEDYWYG